MVLRLAFILWGWPMKKNKNQTLTLAQKERQKERDCLTGRYTKNPCYGCGKSAPIEGYFSHHLTDCVDCNGDKFGDILLVLCKKCAGATSTLTTVKEVRAYQKKLGVKR